MPSAVSNPKNAVSFLRILAMSFGFFGIQHGFSIQFAKMSVIYEKLGANPDQIPFLWLAAPLTGLLLQPIIGYLSDRTWGPLGRRRPYFLGGAILASIALFFMPNASSLWMAAGFLWLLDASINISMEPFRAFVADQLPAEQVSDGYAMQTFMIGLGGALGFWIASVDWLQKAPWLSAFVPSSLHLQFYLCGLIYLFSIIVTVVTNPEKRPPDEELNPADGQGLSLGNWAHETWDSLRSMPEAMKKLAWVQIFTWIGLFCMWIYYSVAVAHHVFGATDPHSPLYDKGVAAASSSMLVYQTVSMFFALAIPWISRRVGKVTLHTIGLVLAAAGLLSVWFIRDPNWLWLPMIGVGLGWGTILSMPYAILVEHIPQERYGMYMGLFNIFIVLPEIISSLGLGWVMQNVFHNNHMLAIALGGACMLFAAILLQSLRRLEAQSTDDNGQTASTGNGPLELVSAKTGA
jgi:maltose/moltooligosaccharide transporter